MVLSQEEKNRIREIFEDLYRNRLEKWKLKEELLAIQSKCSHEYPKTKNPFSSIKCVHCNKDIDD